MPRSIEAERVLYYGSLLCLLFLLVAAGVWWAERMLFADPAFIAFEIINGGEVVISEHRYAAAVTQAVPLLASWSHLSLPTVLGLYSVNFYVLYASVALVVGLRWKQHGLATLLVVYLTLLVSDGYFWPNNEVHQGVTWAILFLGRFNHLQTAPRSFRWHDHLLLVGFLALATNAHLLVAAPLSFLWVYLLLTAIQKEERVATSEWIVYTLLIGTGIGVRYYLSHDSWYDGYKLEGVKEINLTSAVGSLGSGQVRTMLGRILTDYLTLPVVLLAGWGAAWRAGRGRAIPLTVAAGLVYAILIGITYPAAFGRELVYYFESEWAGLGIIVACPLVLEIRALSDRRWLGVGVVALLFLPRLVAIYHSHDYFATRLENLRRTVILLDNRPEGDKFATENETLLRENFGVYWGMPIEVTLAAAVYRGPDRTVALRVTGSPPLEKDDPLIFQSNFRRQPIRSLNHVYVRLDTVSTYRAVSPALEEEWRRVLHRLPD